MKNALLEDRVIRAALLLIATVALVTALHLAQHVLAPFVFALVLGVVVSPVAERLTRIGIPRLAISTTLLFIVVSAIGVTVLLIEPLIVLAIDELPRIKAVAAYWLESASSILRGIEEISQEIEKSVGAEQVEPQTAIPSVSDALWLAPNFVAQVFVFVGTLFFFVLTRDGLYANLGARESRLRDADRAVSRYFAAVTLVNAILGGVTASVMMAIGLEHPLLWGLAAGLLNFVLYLGPLTIIVGLTIAGMIQFAGASAFLPPLLFLLINLTEANFVTPWVVGKRLSLNPLVIFIAIVFGLWLWGPVGAIVALPVLLWFGVLLKPDLVLTEARMRRKERALSEA